MQARKNSFAQFGLPKSLLQSLHHIKFSEPTPVQAQAIPPAMQGRDILATAQTGTGKTAAFGIPLIVHLHRNRHKKALILAPTRELAAQIHQVLFQISKKLKLRGTVVVGGESFARQVRELERGVSYIVATPGRLNDHLKEGTIRLGRVGFLVLDEMDRMLDMGFAPQITKIIRRLPSERQSFLFSATFPKQANELAMKLLEDPVRVSIAPKKETVRIEEENIRTSPKKKKKLILNVLSKTEGKTLVFTRTKSRTENISRLLGKNGFHVVSLHGGRTQRQRKRALNMFRDGTHPVMVATDIAGRGIDICDIENVVNYDLPQTHHDYVHRIGRTARNGSTGKAVNFVTEEDTESKWILTGKNTPRDSVRSAPQKGVRRRNFRGSRSSKPRQRN